MNPVLKLILEGERLTTAQIGEVLNLSRQEVEAEYEKLKTEGVLLGWRPILNPDFIAGKEVHAVIEVKISPEREGGFDRLAQRISQFDHVESCYLMSGGYDLLVFMRADSLHHVASYVFERLSTLPGVLSTATHFMLRAYKEQGYLLGEETLTDKPSMSF
tara:strand:- start:49496 stop:49975 length:480 start_codon:yes stop_codon:yes gene_type:complete